MAGILGAGNSEHYLVMVNEHQRQSYVRWCDTDQLCTVVTDQKRQAIYPWDAVMANKKGGKPPLKMLDTMHQGWNEIGPKLIPFGEAYSLLTLR